MDPKLFTKTLIQIAIARRSYYTSRTRPHKPSLYSKISPLGNPKTSVVPELDDWVHNGNKLRVAELQRIVHDLRKRKRFTQALQVCNFSKFAECFWFCLCLVAQKMWKRKRKFKFLVFEFLFKGREKLNPFCGFTRLRIMHVYVANGNEN